MSDPSHATSYYVHYINIHSQIHYTTGNNPNPVINRLYLILKRASRPPFIGTSK